MQLPTRKFIVAGFGALYFAIGLMLDLMALLALIFGGVALTTLASIEWGGLSGDYLWMNVGNVHLTGNSMDERMQIISQVLPVFILGFGRFFFKGSKQRILPPTHTPN